MYNRNAMYDFFIKENKRVNRNLIAVNVLLLLFSSFILYMSSDFINNFVNGPFHMAQSDLNKKVFFTNEPREYFKLQVSNELDTGSNEIRVTKNKYTGQVKSEEIVSDYKVTEIDGGYLAIKSEHGKTLTSKVLEGKITYLPNDLKERLEKQFKGIKIYPVMFVEESYRGSGYFWLPFFLGLTLLSLMNIKKGFERISNFHLSKVYNDLVPYGNPHKLTTEISEEVFKDGTRINSKTIITKNWIIYKGFLSTKIANLKNTAWAYKKVVRKTAYYIIPVGKEVSVIINTYNNQFEINLSEKSSNKLLECIFQKAPWVLLGYDKRIVDLWGKEKHSLISKVEERKNAYFTSYAFNSV